MSRQHHYTVSPATGLLTTHPTVDGDEEIDYDIVSKGFRLERKPVDSVYPNGFYLVYRRFDGKVIGRVEREKGGWNGRYWYFGGGSTYGTFRTRYDAALFVLRRNSTLDEGWDE
jgi:hypothetical protein